MKADLENLGRDLRKRTEELTQQIADSTLSHTTTEDLLKKIEDLRMRAQATASRPQAKK